MAKAGISYCYGYMPACADVDRPSGVKSTSDGATYSYDGNGNISIGAGRTYVWNVDNRLDQVTGPGGSAVMTYDYNGIRIKKSGSSGTTYFPFTGYEVQGGTVTKFIRIGNETIASKQGATTKRFYHNDHLGGVNILSDINGAQLQLTEYDPWGKVSRSEGNVDPTHRFTGQELDSESDIHYYGGRYYHQALGRFISPDPFVQNPDDPQNLNRFSYVLNSPQNYIDPSGYNFLDIGEFFSGIGSFFSRGFSSSSYQSAVNSTVPNNDFTQSMGLCSGCGESGTTHTIYLRKEACEVCALLDLPQNAALRDTLARRNYDRPVESATIDPIDFIPFSAAVSAMKGVFAGGIRALGSGAFKSGTTGFIDPSKVRFTQDSVGYFFKKGGGSIDEVARALRGAKGTELAAGFDPIRLVNKDGVLYTLDNRRLAAFAAGGQQVPYRWATTQEIALEWTNKFTTTAEQGWGRFIEIRPAPPK